MINKRKFQKTAYTKDWLETEFLPQIQKSEFSLFIYQGGRLKCISDSFFREFGYEKMNPEEVDAALWHRPEEHQRFLENVKKIIDGQKIENDDYLVLAGDGKETGTRVQLECIGIKDQESVCVCILVKDPPPSSIEGKFVNLNDDIFRIIAEKSLNGIVLLDESYHYIYANPAVLVIYGYDSFEQGAKVPILNTIAPESLQLVAERAKNRLEGRPNPPRVTYKIIRTDGEIRDLEVMSGAVYVNGMKCHLNTVIDITDRKKAQENLLNTASEWRRTFDVIPDLIMVIDSDYRITRVNEAMAKALRIPYKEILGQKCYRLIHGTEKAPEFCIQKKVSQDGEKIVREIYLDKFGGDFSLTSTPIINDAGVQIGSVHVFSNITERKRAERDLLNYQEQLRSLSSQLTLTEDRERRRIATILHDQVGQLLAVSKMRLGSLRRTSPTAEYVESIDEVQGYIDEAIKATRTLINEISPPALHDLGLEAAIEQLAQKFNERHGIECIFESDKQEKPLDDDVCVILYQSVRELLMNVAKHAQARETRISLQRDGDLLRIDVTDNGVGFDYSKIGNYKGVGDGFGLFNIRERLDHLGGSVEIMSEPGKGTTTILLAPLKIDMETEKGKSQ